MLLLKKATDSTLEPCSVHAVEFSLETDVLRLINQLNGVSLFFFFFAISQTAYLNTRPELVLALRKARKENKPWHVQIECETFYSQQ
jgi:hypothetical protein